MRRKRKDRFHFRYYFFAIGIIYANETRSLRENAIEIRLVADPDGTGRNAANRKSLSSVPLIDVRADRRYAINAPVRSLFPRFIARNEATRAREKRIIDYY